MGVMACNCNLKATGGFFFESVFLIFFQNGAKYIKYLYLYVIFNGSKEEKIRQGDGGDEARKKEKQVQKGKFLSM